MNVDIAIGVIEEIARKLSVPAEQIVPELSRMNRNILFKEAVDKQ